MTTKTAAPAARFKSRKYGAHGHGYLLDGEKVDGVTGILNALPKSLKQWGADCAANYAIEHWSELSETPLTKRLDRIRYAHKETLSEASARGTEIHGYAEQLVHGTADQVPDEHIGPAQALARCYDLWQLEPIATEALVGSVTHRYGGRGDLWATIGVRDGARAYVDVKTGKNIYESVVLQCAAYDGAELWQPDGVESEEPYEPVELVYVAHVLPDDVRMLPIRGAGGAVKPGPAEFREFLYLQQTTHWLDRHGYRGDEPLVEAAERP